MSKSFAFGNDVRIDTNDLDPAVADRFGLAIGRTFAAAVLVGAVVTVSSPSQATAQIIADATLRPVREAMPHTVVRRAPEVINEASIETIHAKAGARLSLQVETARVAAHAPARNTENQDLEIM